MTKIIPTGDGSPTLQSEQFEVTYHSIHGAIQESQVVFIDAALDHLAAQKTDLSILEMGFGSGLNALMTYLEAEKRQLNIQYTTLEAYPIILELATQLDYANRLQAPESHQVLLDMHALGHDEWKQFSPHFQFKKLLQRLEDFEATAAFDIVFYDAFAPAAQPELWEPECLGKLYQALRPGGVLTTYCAKGAFKRALKALGFEVEALPGPIGKREMTRAKKI